MGRFRCKKLPTDLTLILETADGVMIRRVSSAAPLPGRHLGGYEAEFATDSAAVRWGPPDLLFPGRVVQKGNASREIGDSLVVTADHAAVVQVKSRPAPTQDADKERRWLDRHIGKALRQGAGSVRTLGRGLHTLSNARGRDVDVDGAAKEWIVVVVVDHAHCPEDYVPALPQRGPAAVVLLRRDWEFLFDQLKATHAVIEYLARVANEPSPLGEEPARYYECALNDEAAEPSPMTPGLLGVGRPVSEPLLPLAPAGTREDFKAHSLLRSIVEDIALSPLGEALTETQRVRMLMTLDRLPVAQRRQIGDFILDQQKALERGRPDALEWRIRSMRSGKGPVHLVYGICSEPLTDLLKDAFSLLVQLRHHDVGAALGGFDGLASVGVLRSPRRGGRRRWDTTSLAVVGETDFTDDELAELRSIWPDQVAA